MNIAVVLGFVFLVLALGSAAVSAGVYHAAPAQMPFGLQIVLFVTGACAALGFGFLAAIFLLIGPLT